MRIVVNHLTRMGAGYICVAGIDVSNGRHIRLVLSGRLTTSLLTANGGPFALASLIDLGTVKSCGYPPEVEDHFFNPLNVQVVRTIKHEQFWKLLESAAKKSFTEIFGSAIKTFHQGCIVDKGVGKASLGCFIPTASPHLYISNYGKIRIHVTDGSFSVDLSVTDIRLCETDHRTPKIDLIRQFDARMRKGASVILSIGLARAWKQPGDDKERHWLQVNNIHFMDSI